jgi:hypothetical protein
MVPAKSLANSIQAVKTGLIAITKLEKIDNLCKQAVMKKGL